MKSSNFLLSTLVFVCALSLSAQTTVGLHGSYGNAWQNYGDDFNPPNGPLKITSFSINASVYRPVSNVFSIGLEPGYTRRGAACFPGFVDGDFPSALIQDRTFYANYVQLPLMLKGEFLVFGNAIRVFGKIGVGPSYITKAYWDIILFTSTVPPVPPAPERVSVDFGDSHSEINRWDIGSYTGIGIGFPIGPGVVELESNYYYGLLDSSNNLRTRNRTLRFGLGYSISL